MNQVRRTETGRAIAMIATALAIPAISAVFYFTISGLLGVKTSYVRQRWEATFGSVDEILERYPSRGANASALGLESLTAALGIDIAPRLFDGRARPTAEASARHEGLKSELGSYLNEQVERAERHIGRPPPGVAEFLNTHASEIEAVRERLLIGEAPEWVRELDRLFDARLPNLLGHIHLQRLLLADALVRVLGSDIDGALGDLEASWRLNSSLSDEPILIVQLVRIAVARMQAGVLRQIDDAPIRWLDRLRLDDYRGAFLTAMRFEAWMLTKIDDPSLLDSRAPLWRRVLYKVGEPYVRYCIADTSDTYRRRVERLERMPALCDTDLRAWGANFDVPVPRWNFVGDVIVPGNLNGAVDRLRRLELDLELTAVLLNAEAVGDAGDDGSRTESIEASKACPDDGWILETRPAGPVSIAFSRKISWPDQMGAVLPTRFVVER